MARQIYKYWVAKHTHATPQQQPQPQNIYVSFVSDEIFENLVNGLLQKYKRTISHLEKNIIDPFKVLFDIHEEWKKHETMRQIDKSVNNEIGYFHQKLLGSVKGWINIDETPELKREFGADLCNEDKSIFIELKNKHNTMNSGGKHDVIRRLNNILAKRTDAKVFIGVILAKNKKSVDDNGIATINGAEVYEMITGNKNAMAETLSALGRYFTNHREPGSITLENYEGILDKFA